ncbi:MAG: hypothetical protein H7A51_04165 [Akkermansiaceae bacterium]|nr:hypothetical protein [Akkermansiaceae bacterium]
MKRLILLLGIMLFVLPLVSCGDSPQKPPPPPPPVVVHAPDYKPLSEGWKVQSYALIGIAVIIAIALMSKSKNPNP